MALVAALAAALGTAPVFFPGGHLGVLDDPDGFAVRYARSCACTPG